MRRGFLLVFVACWVRPITADAAKLPPGTALPSGIAVRDGKLIADKDGMEMVVVHRGAFVMGRDDGNHDERPAHEVRLDDFLIDRHEVTNAQYERFERQSGHRSKGPWRRGFAGAAQANHPVRFVTWHDALAYAKWAGRALPTEAQWEKAARGSKGALYPWGSAWQADRSRSEAEVDEGPTAVGSFPQGASPYGAVDMAGNVWEWVADWYDRRAYQNPQRERVDPRGPADGAPPERMFRDSGTAAGNERSTRKVIRGGGWVRGGRENSRTSKRFWGNPSYWFNDTGFRCALPLRATPRRRPSKGAR